MAADAVDCGSYACPAGSHCGANERCVKNGPVDCGSYTCQAGEECGEHGCRPAGSMTCGDGGYCKSGTKCRKYEGDGWGCVSTAHKPADAPPRVPVERRITELERLASVLQTLFYSRSALQDLTAAVRIVGMPWAVDVAFADEMQRAVVVERTKSKLRDLETKVLIETITRMRADVQNLIPLDWDSEAVKAEKRRAVEETDRELSRMFASGKHELAAPGTLQERPYTPPSTLGYYYQKATSGFTTTIDFTPGPTLRRLEEIHRTGRFWD